MLPKALLAAALATSTASAFLLPPPTDVELERTKPFDVVESGDSTNNKEGDFHALPFDVKGDDVASANPFYHEFTKVKVACPGCPMTVRKHKHHKSDDSNENKDKDANIVTVTGVPNHIQLYFSIDHAKEHDRLLVNGFELYPDVDVYNSVLKAIQIPDHHRRHHGKGKHHHEGSDEGEKKAGNHHHHEDDEKKSDHHRHDDKDEEELKRRHHSAEGKHHKEHKHHKNGKHAHKHAVSVPLGYSLQAQAVGQDASNGMEVVGLSLQIIEVNNVFIQGIPAVSIRLIRTPEGGLMIGRIDVDEIDKKAGNKELSHHGHGHGGDRMAELKKALAECDSFVCRWKAVVAASMKSHGCKGKAMHASQANQDETNGDDDKDHPHHRHHHHHHKILEHSWSRLFKKFGSHILFPVLIGITAGVVVSLVGMLVGSVVVSLWRLVFRRRQAAIRTHHHHRHRHSRSRNATAKADRREQGADEEKASLVAAAESVEAESVEAELPPYEDKDPKTEA